MNATDDRDIAGRDDQAAAWCLRLSEGALSASDRGAFDRWIADADNAAAFDDTTRAWRALEAAAEVPEVIQMRSAALDDYYRANRLRWSAGPSRSRRLLWPGVGIGAAMAGAILFGSLAYHPDTLVRTGIGERRVAALDDGSQLALDADTQVRVDLRRDRRTLTLVRGRAQFTVAHDPLRPFTVTAGDRTVVATGTSFSVEIVGREVHVLLYEGRVAVINRGDGKPVADAAPGARGTAADAQLGPGRELVMALAGSAPATVEAVDPSGSAGWKDGQLAFDDEPLETAVERVNRYSARKLKVGDAAAARIRVNGVFDAGDVAAFLDGVTALNPVRADTHGMTTVLHGDRAAHARSTD